MNWVSLINSVCAGVLGFFAGYYFIVARLLKSQIETVRAQLQSAIELFADMDTPSESE